ncbi:MAG: hypothetical protein U0Q22_07085 [Acidimicrobiales bacterium]
MGQLVGRNTGQDNQQLAGTTQSLFMDPCVDCGAPVSVVAKVKPDPMRCASCAAAAAAAATED